MGAAPSAECPTTLEFSGAEPMAARLQDALADLEMTDHQQRFWKRYMAVAFAVLAGESAGSLAYFLLSPATPHRRTLELITAITAAAATAVLPLVGDIATRRWRSQLSFAMT